MTEGCSVGLGALCFPNANKIYPLLMKRNIKWIRRLEFTLGSELEITKQNVRRGVEGVYTAGVRQGLSGELASPSVLR